MRRRSIALGIAASILAAVPASAVAAGVDQTSDHAALTAYHAYIAGVIAQIPAARKADAAFTDSITQGCPNALAALAGSSASSVNQTALFDFGLELGGDLAVTADAPARGRLAQFGASLEQLRWSSSQTARTIKRYLAAQSRLFGLAPSDLCADAEALVASHAQSTPPGTAAWVAKLRGAVLAREAATQAFGHVLRKFQAPADQALAASDIRLNRRLFAKLSGVVTSSATKLLANLGLRTSARHGLDKLAE